MAHYTVDFNPIAFTFGAIAMPWYWLVYFVGYLWMLWFAPFLTKAGHVRVTKKEASDFVIAAFFLMLLFSRMTYVLLYNFSYYLADWTKIYQVWEGGMSFHGGLVGVLIAALYFSRKKKYSFTEFTDLAATGIPIVLFFGRLANFINGELAGRVSDVSWAMIFPRYGDGLSRHPSQLYEAVLEGLVSAIILWATRRKLKHPGFQSGLFLLLYGTGRFIVEFFRAPDVQLGLYLNLLTMGQILCLLMIVFGTLIVMKARKVTVRSS